jgi:hypothetical protein
MTGFEPVWMPDMLFDFQKFIATWTIQKGKAAELADCGLGKSFMELVWAENIVRKTNGRVLLLTPLAVGQQMVKEGVKIGVECKQCRDGCLDGMPKIIVTNYEKLHLFDPSDFVGCVCDESSILKHFTGATQKQVTRFMCKLPFRLLGTATAAPNDYIELGTSSEALGELSYSEMLTRYFRQLDDKGQKKELKDQAFAERSAKHFARLSFRVAQSISQWRLKNHAVTPFWRWVASWAKACRMPSDLGFDNGKFILPELKEHDHVIIPGTAPDGMLFTLPAFGLKEEREERRRTLKERCEYAADLVKHDNPAVIWCHMNDEGKLLERLIPNSIEVAGSHSDEYKEAAAAWFIGEKCICNDPMFSAKLTAWQKEKKVIGRDIIESIAQNACLLPASGSGIIQSNERNTCKTTIQITRINGNQQLNRSQGKEIEETPDTQLTKNLDGKLSKPQNETGSSIQQDGQTNPCGILPPHSKHTKKPLKAKTESALSVEEKKATGADTDCTLTTATKQCNTGECSAQIVILDSESLATVSKLLNVPQCICGHKSGNRKLISKSRIFGFGLNFQHCAHVVTFATHSYEQYYQSVRRCWRFGQKNPVRLDVIATEGERRVIENMRAKAVKADLMFASLVEQMNNPDIVRSENKTHERIKVPTWIK